MEQFPCDWAPDMLHRAVFERWFRRFSIQRHRQFSMSILTQTAMQHPVGHIHQPLMPHWLTHLGVLGLFSVAIVDSSVIPLPLPGSTDLLLLWLVAHSGDPWLLAACAVAGSIVGGYTTWHIRQKRRRSGTAPLRAGASPWAGRRLGRASPHPRRLSSGRCFHRRFRCCPLSSPPVRWASHAGASWPCTARLAHPALLVHRLAWRRLTGAGSSACGREAFRSGRLRCSAVIWDCMVAGV